MNVHVEVIGDFQTNAYLIVSESPTGCLLVDAPYPADPLVDLASSLGVTPTALILTHGHIDHIAGSDEVRRAFPGISVIASRETGRHLRRPSLNLSVLLGGPRTFPPPDQVVGHDQVMTPAGIPFRAILIDGHSAGSLCLYHHASPPVLFSGDTLFAGSIGRTDFPGGSLPDLLEGIRRHIMSLPDETVIYPGHGPATTVFEERGNPFILASDQSPG